MRALLIAFIGAALFATAADSAAGQRGGARTGGRTQSTPPAGRPDPTPTYRPNPTYAPAIGVLSASRIGRAISSDTLPASAGCRR